ncbi:EamA family transporter [Pseudomonas sp. NPDC008258]|uniref:EamA family transporter n=1 Tax=Pseudomonas sp. NPDC008258 TaxID=3364418 RepID=UPI0036EB51E1
MNVALVLATLALTCLGQIAQKLTVQHWQGQPAKASGWLRIRCAWPWVAAASLGCGLLCWMLVLQRMDVGIAYPMLSLNFVLITIASRLLFGEAVDTHHLLGLGLIVVGVCLLGSGL